MKPILRVSGLVLAAAALVIWFALGANTGWTKTSVTVQTVDEVTGLVGIENQPKFLPGIELLGLALLGGTLLIGMSFIIRKRSIEPLN